MQSVVIDDNPIDLKRFTRALVERHQSNVLAVSSLTGNLERIVRHNPMMVLLDDRLGPVLTAEDSLKSISEFAEALPVVVMSSDVAPSRRAQLIRLGAFECVEKDSLDAAMLDLIIEMAKQRNAVIRR